MTDRPDSARRGRTAPPRRARAAIQSSHRPAGQPRPWQQVSTLRLETFSDGVFAIAVTLLALQLHPPNLTGVTTAGAVLHASASSSDPHGWWCHRRGVHPWRRLGVTSRCMGGVTCGWM